MKKRIETLIKLGIFAALVMYMVNKFVESSALLRKLLKKDGGRYFHWSHGSVFYKKKGSGSPLLLLHDLYPTSSMAEWSEIEEDLAKSHTVYLVDLPGCGRSSKDASTYVNYIYVEFLKEFVEEVIGEQTDILATGMSGSFTVMAARIHPDLIGKLTLINPEHPAKLEEIPTQKSKITKGLMDCPILGTFLYYIYCSENQIEYDFTENYFYNPFLVSSRMMHTYYEAAHLQEGSGKHLLASLHSSYINVNIEQAFSSLEQEVHLILGKELPAAEFTADAYEELRSGISIDYIPKTKMLPQLEAPAKLLALL